MQRIPTPFILLLALLLPSLAAAQSASDTQVAGATAAVDINVLLNVQSAVTLTCTGGAGTSLTNAVGNTADLDFGTVNTLNPVPLTGTGYRTTDAPGAHFVGTIDCTVDVSGTPNGAALELYNTQTNAVDPIPPANLKWALASAATDWTLSTSGTAMSTSLATPDVLSSNVYTGDPAVSTEISVFVADGDAAGTQSQVVEFRATPNP